MAVDVVFVVEGPVCFFFGEVGTGVFEARDSWGMVLGVRGWRVEEENVMGAQTFVEPIHGVKVHEGAGDGVGEGDALG